MCAHMHLHVSTTQENEADSTLCQQDTLQMARVL
jgi:hypothetical protein